MAETVLSMARSLVGNAITKAGEAAAAEISLLIGVNKEIWFIKDELKTMQAFLMTAEEMEKKPRLLKAWVEQVRDLSFDIEDCLAEFMVHVGSKSLSQQLMKLKHRHRIAIQIRDLKSRVEEVSDRNSRYSLISPNTDEHDTLRDEFRYWSAKNIDEAELVGFDDAKESILNLIDVHANHDLAKVIFVVGMGGLGRTSLVKKVYHSINIVNNFSCRAWVTVSQSFVRTELLRGLIKQLLGGDSENEHFKGLQSMQRNEKVEDLVEDLKQGLKEKRYFVVLDDMWSIDALNWLNESVFPDSINGGSRIIVTTRDASIIQNCAYPSYLYRLEPLKTDDAKQLLLRKSNKSYEDIKRGKAEKVLDRILERCGGLPLALVAIGAVLRTKCIEDWEKLSLQLSSGLKTKSSLEEMTRVITLSYTHLPSHLKPCFLYLSIFPEDFPIKRRCMVNRWIAEGFVDAKFGMAMEDVGNSYFDELINRSMIQPCRFYSHGVVQSCVLHDIMRDIAISISAEENFVFMTKGFVSGIPPENIRHLSIDGRQDSYLSFDLSHVRSLSFFYSPKEQLASLCSPQLRMLRVLDLEFSLCRVTQNDISNIGSFCHLRYLSVKKAETNPRRWWRSSARVSVPKGIGSLKELQILELVDIARSNKKAVHELGELTQLKKLGVAGVTERNVNYLCEALQKLSSLCSLRVEAKPFRGLHMLEQLASPPPFLHTLKLKGSLHEIPSWVGKLEKLVKVQLVFTKLKDTESIQVLGELPGLKCLRLILNAYIGKELVLCHGKFRGLKTLRLDSLEELRKVTFEERTSPKLETITIQDCSSELAVCGTANLQSLEKIKYFAKGKLVKGDMHGERPVVQAGQSQSAHHREDIKAAEIIEKSQTSSLEKGESSQSIPRPDVLRTLPPISATTKLKRSLSCPASTSIVM
uniref:NBS-LRR-like resistance protein n=1 Tax=Oryza sativa TaxID=4530 RepID=A0A0U2RPG6_ORYSA|nr:NBS-LRR-like resistance protein [Oryza sativa]